MSPFLIFFTIFIIIPVLVALYLSLTSYNMIEFPKFVGFTNFKLLFMDDSVFIIALKNTLIFSVITGPIGFFMSFFMAWIINNLKPRGLFSLAFYAPSITSGVAMSTIWLYFFSPDRYGFVNNILINMGILNQPVLWNINPKTILGVVILVSVWMSMGTGFLVFLAGLQSVPSSLYEAANIDGIKNRFQEMWYITLPMLKPQMLFGAINSIVASLGVFDIAVAIAGMPSPNYAAHTIVSHLYDYAFIRFEMGYASAIAVLLFILSFSLGQVFIRIFASKGE